MARAREPKRPEGFTPRRVGAMVGMLVIVGGAAWLGLFLLTSRPLDEITSRGLPVWVVGGGTLVAAGGGTLLVVIGAIRAWRYEKVLGGRGRGRPRGRDATG